MTTRFRTLLAGGVVLCSLAYIMPAAGRNGVSVPDPPWNPDHFKVLPPEIKKAIAPLCKSTPLLGHYFALYAENSRFMNLHFEYFHCEGVRPFCTPAGCLHQVYVLTNGRYRPYKTFYRAEPD